MTEELRREIKELNKVVDLCIESYKTITFLRSQFVKGMANFRSEDWQWLQAVDHNLDNLRRELNLGHRNTNVAPENKQVHGESPRLQE